MKKLVISLAIISTLGLTACDSETIEDVKNNVEENGTAVLPAARVVFDPPSGIAGLSVPNDFVFIDTLDGTLEIPVDDPTDGSDPFVAASALDGWSTVQPFIISIDFPAGRSLDSLSVLNTSSVRVFEALMGGDPGCEDVPRGSACQVVDELIFSQDYITQAVGNAVAFVPLKPLKAKTTYLIALTDSLVDDLGNPIAGSTTYELARQDINTKPLGDESQLGLQGAVNSYEIAVVAAGVESDKIIYTMAMTTQSTTDVSFTVKSMLAGNLAATGLPPKITIGDPIATVSQVLFGGMPPSQEIDYLYSTANYHTGSVTLPYYLGIPSITNPMAPVNDWWKGLCDSGAMLAGFVGGGGELPEGPLTDIDAFCMSVGLRDVSSVMALDTERNLTKFNPVPAARDGSDMLPWLTHPGILDVQMTTPIISPITDAVRAGFGLPPLTVMPTDGWPVVILQHGITSKKEDMLAVTGVLSAFGFATIAIDHPLHGSRGFDLLQADGITPGPDGIDEINASTVSATHYMNLGSLLTMRDNVRQSVADSLGLRLGMSYTVIGDGMGVKIDPLNVHLLGHSLGAITGINLVALANTSIGNEVVDAMFNIKTNSLAMPGVMMANFLMESGSFGDIIKANITYAASEDFKNYVDTLYPNGATDDELAAVFNGFYATLPPADKAALDAGFDQFTLITQTVIGAADPINYTAGMAATQTPTHLIEVVGTGVECVDVVVPHNCSDQTVPNTASTSPLAGTEGAIALLGLPGVSTTTPGSGAVRFIYGHHGSLLSPSAQEGISPDPITSALATQEMQGQAAGFFFSMGQLITITDETVVH